MERRLDPVSLQRLAEERHKLVTGRADGSVQSYNAAVDAFRLAQNSNPSRPSVSDSPSVGYSGKDRSYEMLE